MLKEVLASNAAKLLAACVCPVVGAGVVAMEVPKVRAALHKVTAPKAKRVVRKQRTPKPVAGAEKTEMAQAAMSCPPPVVIANRSIEPQSVALALPSTRIEMDPPERIYLPAACPAVQVAGGSMAFRFAAVPEAATWAQMILGFGLAGGVLRRRRSHKAVTPLS